jgi:hypothetical protein
MEKTNFTFVRTFVQSVLILLVMGFTINLAGQGIPCYEPYDGYADVLDETTVLLEWRSSNAPITDHCWNLEIGAVNFDCGEGEAVVSSVLCYNGTDDTWSVTNQQHVSVVDYSVSGGVRIKVKGLQAGTSYAWTLVETCDGTQPPWLVSSCKKMGYFTTFDSPFVLSSSNIVSPSCPEVSPGYACNGSFDVTIADPTTCPGTTYSMEVTAVPNSSPEGNTPSDVHPSYVGHVTAGTGTFTNACAGSYLVVVYETGPCNPESLRQELLVVVPDGVDSVEPVWFIYDLLGNIVADNHPETLAGEVVTLPDWTLPEGECSYQELFFAEGWDACDGRIYPLAAVTAAPSTTPDAIDPGTQAVVTNNVHGLFLPV